MRILYDYQAFTMQRYGGVSNCFAQLISNLPASVSFDIGICECDNVHLRDCKIKDVPPLKDYYDNFLLKKRFAGQSFLYASCSKIFPSTTSVGRNILCSIEKLKQGDYDVFHPTFFKPYFLKYLPQTKPFVLTVHDMISELIFKNGDEQARQKAKLCGLASHIIVVSEKTKNDLMEILHVPEDKISVIYHGAPSFSYEPLSTPIFVGRYILYVGQRSTYKSFIPMLRALMPVMQRHRDVFIVCTGPDFSKEELDIFKSMNVIDRIVHRSVNNSELLNLYTHAECFVYPSQYEGFGIPILESYAARCPVLLNYASCFPEIAQDAAIYFHLDDVSSDLDVVMENFLSMEVDEKKRIVERQLQRLESFSWETSAKQLAGVYSQVIKNR